MGTQHIKCDQCGIEWDTGKRWNEGPLRAAQAAGWLIAPAKRAWDKSPAGQDLCPICAERAAA